MRLFGKKKEEKACCCSEAYKEEALKAAEKSKATGSGIKILGSGCAKCRQLEANTLEALRQLGMDTPVEHVTDFTQIALYGVMTTPALVADGKVISYGKVPTAKEVAELLQKVR